MLIGLTGAQGSGKTTLGSEFAKRNVKYAFAATSVSSIMRSCGMDPAKDYPLMERIQMQEHILAELDAFYGRFNENTVFDRTPLDAAAYMLADVQRENVPPSAQEAISRYLAKCFDVTNRRFAMLMFVPAVLQHTERRATPRDGKAPSDPAYVEHISALIGGLVHDQRNKLAHVRLARSIVAIDDRVAHLTAAVQKVLANFQGVAEEMAELH